MHFRFEVTQFQKVQNSKNNVHIVHNWTELQVNSGAHQKYCRESAVSILATSWASHLFQRKARSTRLRGFFNSKQHFIPWPSTRKHFCNICKILICSPTEWEGNSWDSFRNTVPSDQTSGSEQSWFYEHVWGPNSVH